MDTVAPESTQNPNNFPWDLELAFKFHSLRLKLRRVLEIFRFCITAFGFANISSISTILTFSVRLVDTGVIKYISSVTETNIETGCITISWYSCFGFVKGTDLITLGFSDC